MEMEYRILGRTGLRVSRIGIGTEHLALAAPENRGRPARRRRPPGSIN
jgi:aryl-alcohol dehydrogenase-like predicted oxidoreductase